MVGIGGHSYEKGGSVGKSQTKSARREEVVIEVHTDDEHLCRESLWK